MGLTEQGLGVPGSASAPVPPLDALASDETAVQEAVAAVTADVAMLAGEGVSSASLTSATTGLGSATATEAAATAALATQVEST